MNFKIAFFIILISLLVTNVFWVYLFVDQSISYDYNEQEIKYLKKSVELIKTLLFDSIVVNKRRQIIKIVKTKYPNHILKEEEDIFYIDNIGLKFDGDKLVEIVVMN